MRDTRNTSITHRDLAHDRCEKSSRGIWQRVDTATRYRACRCGTLRAEWQCNSRQPVRSRSSGSALHTATRYRACRCGTLRAEWQCNSRQPVRSRSSGSAGRDGPKPVNATSMSGRDLSEAGPKPYQERPLREGDLFATGWMQLATLFAGWMVPFLQAGRSPGRSG